MMSKFQSLTWCLFIISAHVYAGPYAPAAGETGSTAIFKDDFLLVGWATAVADYSPGSDVAPMWQKPTNALGKAQGTSGDICCLGRHGSITLTFSLPISDRPGWDFATFENSFSATYLELGWVEVSSDGTNFYRLPNNSLTESSVSSFGNIDPTDVTGYCSKYIQGWGTPFDLADIVAPLPSLNRSAVTHVRILDIVGDGSCTDSFGNVIYDPYPTSGSAGVDLDAVGVIHQIPEPAYILVIGLFFQFFYSLHSVTSKSLIN